MEQKQKTEFLQKVHDFVEENQAEVGKDGSKKSFVVLAAEPDENGKLQIEMNFGGSRNANVEVLKAALNHPDTKEIMLRAFSETFVKRNKSPWLCKQ